MKLKLIVPVLLSVLITSFVLSTSWKADDTKAQVKFSVMGPLGKVEGTFSGLKAVIVFDEKNLASSSITASVNASTIKTGIDLRNKDLQKEEWLNAVKYPLISFRSTQIQKTATGYKVTGNLTIKESTKPVEIVFTFSQTGNKAVLKGGFTINREDYGVGKSEITGKEVTLLLEVPVSK